MIHKWWLLLMSPLLFYGHIAQSVEPVGGSGPPGGHTGLGPVALGSQMALPSLLETFSLWISFTKSTQPLARFGVGAAITLGIWAHVSPLLFLATSDFPSPRPEAEPEKLLFLCWLFYKNWPSGALSVTSHFT